MLDPEDTARAYRLLLRRLDALVKRWEGTAAAMEARAPALIERAAGPDTPDSRAAKVMLMEDVTDAEYLRAAAREVKDAIGRR